ncbi:MAG: CvpA family protein [Lachnospiraceae bacterium]|nr:CvpA family protein [Lachnospiraceae bacterium]
MGSLVFILIVGYVIYVLHRNSGSPKGPLKTWQKIVSLIAILAVWYYAEYPAVNIHSYDFWLFCVVAVILVILLFVPAKEGEGIHIETTGNKTFRFHLPKTKKGPVALAGYIIAGVIAVNVVVGIIFSPLVMSSSYAKRISVNTVSFSEIPAYKYNQTAIIDRSSAELLGDKVMGQMTDLVSQFSVSSEYNQVSYENGTRRVTPLAYDGFIKYLRNRSAGVPGYIIVNTTTGATELVRLENKMHYVPSAYFNENLYRHLRFRYPTVLFGDPSFEIDDEGNPYYVCTTYTYTGIHSMRKVTGVILLDPRDGSSQKYKIEDVPSWVDRVYPESLIEDELNDYGQYQKGFINSILGQEGVTQTSQGYNYISKDGDIWYYTGMTSAVSDESNVGFMLVNLRTHEAQFTATSGATETAVMRSAEGEVLNYGYTATFPTLINVGGKPVYLLSLKDSADLIKMYAMVDAQDYQQVYTVRAEKDTASAISTLIRQVGGESQASAGTEEEEITIEAIRTAVIDGDTYVYIKSGDFVYRISVDESNAASALFLSQGDIITVLYAEDSSSGERIITQIK